MLAISWYFLLLAAAVVRAATYGVPFGRPHFLAGNPPNPNRPNLSGLAEHRQKTLRVATPPLRPIKRQASLSAGRCGVKFGTSCEKGECCSKEGWCGRGYYYCSSPACQINHSDSCDASIRPEGRDTANVPRPRLGSVAYGEAIYHCEEYGAIALSYDDGPFEYTEDLLDLLAKYKAKATFFITGRNLGKGAINDRSKPWRAIIERMARDGHQIASHTWSHQRLTHLTKEQFRRQMIYNEVALADILGYFPTYMRPPYSASDARVDGWLGDLGYHVTYFNLDTEGYLHDSPALIQQSKGIWDAAVEGKNPAATKWLQIEHDPVHQSVYNLTEHMLRSLTRNGFRSVTVGECLGDPAENWYRRLSSPLSNATVRPITAAEDAKQGLGHVPEAHEAFVNSFFDLFR
ncbi:hypothetical protein HIM_07829 [Hirsutella minnesotensis 3608]|uniref:NodB homology domain-containing protein n=1 Tax=Hirsutella minnesotensis 3608 TaxID=1043627 RepID=A0A0F8A408_9HYPO|nr:hypothetical protein HIM_07829 [Hirsutella minnesotensis 3608]